MAEIFCGVFMEFPERFDSLAVSDHGSFDWYALIIPRLSGLVKWTLYELVATPVVLDENFRFLFGFFGSYAVKSVLFRVLISFLSLFTSTSAYTFPCNIAKASDSSLSLNFLRTVALFKVSVIIAEFVEIIESLLDSAEVIALSYPEHPVSEGFVGLVELYSIEYFAGVLVVVPIPAVDTIIDCPSVAYVNVLAVATPPLLYVYSMYPGHEVFPL